MRASCASNGLILAVRVDNFALLASPLRRRRVRLLFIRRRLDPVSGCPLRDGAMFDSRRRRHSICLIRVIASGQCFVGARCTAFVLASLAFLCTSCGQDMHGAKGRAHSLQVERQAHRLRQWNVFPTFIPLRCFGSRPAVVRRELSLGTL